MAIRVLRVRGWQARSEDAAVCQPRRLWTSAVEVFPRSKEDGGAWLNTGRGSPTIVIEEEELATLLERSGLDNLDDLSGSFFAIMGKLRHGPNGRQYFFVNEDVDWMAVRPFVDDEALN